MSGLNKNVAVFSKGLLKNKDILHFLNVNELVYKPKKASSISFVVGWGNKGNTLPARSFANTYDLDYHSLEDGFIHSLGQGVLGAKSCSLVIDQKGIYYDATQESDLENLLQASGNNPDNIPIPRPEVLRSLIARLMESNISKYNNGSFCLGDLKKTSETLILIIDQTAGDMSLEYGYASKPLFNKMVEDAIEENPNAQILVKTHPDVIAGKKKGNINLDDLGNNVVIISDNINPICLLKEVDTVYVATSQMGFEALMLGKKVICYGVPFYALWGLTEDRSDPSLPVRNRRLAKLSLEEVFYTAYIKYTRYLHPITKKRCDLGELISYFELQFKNRIDPEIPLFYINFTQWKQSYIENFLFSTLHPENKIQYISNVKQVEKLGYESNSQLITWASKDQTEVNKIVKKYGGVPWYVEDGFIRSTGLGSDLTAPASIVLDKTGIYYDPSQPSDLETSLQNNTFADDEIIRAELLSKSLIENELSKYNLGMSFNKDSLTLSDNQQIILVPGQVEDDASIKKGCIDVNTNASLIKVVRDKNPDAFLIYKPHPDVVSRNRKGKVEQSVTDENCDLVLMDASITDCLAVVDEVHTMTSLVGFEALLRNLKVVCYGIPFYSGWGLTEDSHTVNRRTRKLKLNELIHATLIDYPLYMDWNTKTLTTPEVVVEQLRQKIEQQGGKKSNQVFWLTRFSRKVKNFINGVFFSK